MFLLNVCHDSGEPLYAPVVLDKSKSLSVNAKGYAISSLLVLSVSSSSFSVSLSLLALPHIQSSHSTVIISV